MTEDKLREALADCLDVCENDVAELLHSPDAAIRIAARTAIARTQIRNALAACTSLAAEQNYGSQATLTAVERLAQLSDIDEPYIATLKALGIQAAAAGQVERALQLLQGATDRAVVAGQRRDERSRRAMRFAHDREIDLAVASLARHFAAPSTVCDSSKPLRIVITCSALQDEDGPTVIITKRAEHFLRLGIDVEIVSTEMVRSEGMKITERVRALGIPFYQAPAGTYSERINWLISQLTARPAHAISWTTSAHDNLGKLGACIGLAPVQAWDNRSLEPFVGKFDLVYQGVNPAQEWRTEWPGISKYYGSSVAFGDEIDAAVPLSRASLGVPRDAVLLGTFGRMEKCNTKYYLRAMASILKSEPSAWLILAGRDGYGAIAAITAFFTEAAVMDRVRILGPRQSDGPALNKTIDIYCDTYPWVGGQTLLDAMQATRPVVAMRGTDDKNLDPTGVSAISSVAESLLEGVMPIAEAGNVEEYVALARGYISNEAERIKAGAAGRHKAVTDCNAFEKSRAYAEDLRCLVLSKRAGEKEPISLRTT